MALAISTLTFTSEIYSNIYHLWKRFWFSFEPGKVPHDLGVFISYVPEILSSSDWTLIFPTASLVGFSHPCTTAGAALLLEGARTGIQVTEAHY